jgi:isopentenyl-diphosphate Delta-isomerase
LQRNREISHSQRKAEHLRICSEDEVQFKELTAGFEAYRFDQRALPELNLQDVDLSCRLLGKNLKAPLVISSMVGGIEAARNINRALAAAAQALGLAMGVGSQRCLIEEPERLSTFQVRDIAPDILLMANLGAVQLNYGFGAGECLHLVQSIGADALILHLNPLQEALQPGGNTNFAGLLNKIQAVCESLPVPVVVKEVGGGISSEVAQALAGAGAAAIEVAGAGGTCWSEIERLRCTNKLDSYIAGTFSSWGIPTAESIILARRGAPNLPIIASGGIRSGIDAAKAIALGADAAGIAQPLLKAALVSPEEPERFLKQIIEVLRIVLFCTGTANLAGLKNSTSLRRIK